jgi:predicted NAD/FAD-binding protein
MRIAIIGGGAAGLAAAWALSKQHDIMLYERNEWLGGHARTVDVPTAHGRVPVDMAFSVYHEWIFTNFSALLDLLGVETVATPLHTVSASFPGGAWISGGSTPFWKTIEAEADRFQREMPRIVADPMRYARMSLGDYLFNNSYSNDFIYKCICPIGGSRFVTRRGVLSLSVLEFVAAFGPVALFSVLHPTPWRTIRNGTREYVRRIAEGFRDQARLSTTVVSIERERTGVLVRDAQGRRERFDQIVMATPADVALKLIGDPTREEKLLLATDYQDARILLHRDPGAMPKDRSFWAADTYVTTETAPPYQHGWASYYMPAVQPWVQDDIFVTISPPDGLIDSAKIIEERHWRHLVADSVQLLRAMELHRIQGKRRTWFCGEYAGMYGGHESSIVTGLAVATALGAPYPFKDDAAASRVFYDTAVTHMRIVRGRPPELDATWWPPVLAQTNAAVMQAIAREEVRNVVRGYIPAAFRKLLPVLGGLEDAVVNTVAARISLVEQASKSEHV